MASRPVRESILVLAGFALGLAALGLYASTWPPVVIVESSSMMHRDSEVRYGRLGTLDPGDLVIVRDIDSPDDVRTLVEGPRTRYAAPGDVVVFYRAGDRSQTPVIHRAIAYVDVREGNGETVYAVRWDPEAPCDAGGAKDPADPGWCLYDEEGVLIPTAGVQGAGVGMNPYRPNADGFLTKGDNPASNRIIDQSSGISLDAQGRPSVVRTEWIVGKARGELPWIGLLKLAVGSQPNEQAPPDAYVRIGNAYAPKDLWVMLGVTLFVLVGVPLLVDAERSLRKRREK